MKYLNIYSGGVLQGAQKIEGALHYRDSSEARNHCTRTSIITINSHLVSIYWDLSEIMKTTTS